MQRESAKSLLAATAAGLAVAAAAPAAASAHAIIAIDRGTIVYSARDATSQNTLTATVSGDKVRLYDPTVDGGIAPGPCEPGAVDASGYIIEVFCPRDAATRLRIDVADREDAVHLRESGAAEPVPGVVLGGPGSDRLTGGGAADVLDSGPGEDALDGGGGADELRARDGAADSVACGEGADRAIVDELDTVDATCEAVDR
ncbi:MAG TPA: hypothetical protein VGW75_09475, partial [Solirubrobacteraceae bacterium]|nr:hypothetical protein [Solirubrobacteraceae bacterium]